MPAIGVSTRINRTPPALAIVSVWVACTAMVDPGCGQPSDITLAEGSQARHDRSVAPSRLVRHEIGTAIALPVQCQPAGPVAARETGLMCANMLRAFQVGKALISDGGPSSWMRPVPVAWAQVSWPACHFTKASASAVM